MASIGGDTNQLLRKFMKRGRRKPTPADRTSSFPKRGQGENATFSRGSSSGPRNWVQYSDGYIGPNDSATRARHPLGGTRPFGPQGSRKKKPRGAAGYNKGRLPG